MQPRKAFSESPNIAREIAPGARKVATLSGHTVRILYKGFILAFFLDESRFVFLNLTGAHFNTLPDLF